MNIGRTFSFAVLCIAGCAAAPPTIQQQPISADLTRYRSIQVGAEPQGGEALEARLKITELAVLGDVSARQTSDLFHGVFSASTAGQITAIAKELASKLQ